MTAVLLSPSSSTFSQSFVTSEQDGSSWEFPLPRTYTDSSFRRQIIATAEVEFECPSATGHIGQGVNAKEIVGGKKSSGMRRRHGLRLPACQARSVLRPQVGLIPTPPEEYSLAERSLCSQPSPKSARAASVSEGTYYHRSHTQPRATIEDTRAGMQEMPSDESGDSKPAEMGEETGQEEITDLRDAVGVAGTTDHFASYPCFTDLRTT